MARQNSATDTTPPGVQDVVIAVMGITGSGKTTFIQQFCQHNLNIGHDLRSCTATVEVVPCIMPNGRKIFLLDTPGFDDTERTDTDILKDIANYLVTSYQSKIRLTGVIYLHRISDPRVGGSGMKNLKMFRKLCGDQGLGSVVLATTMWSLCPKEDAVRREAQLTSTSDMWEFLAGKGARIFRQDNGVQSGQVILDYLIDRARPITLDIQREMVDNNMKLSETGAGKEVQEDLERMQAEHAEQMRDIREEMAEALQNNDKVRQQELKDYRASVEKKMQADAKHFRELEMSREQLRVQMQKEHSAQIAQLREEMRDKEREIERKEREREEASRQRDRAFGDMRVKMDQMAAKKDEELSELRKTLEAVKAKADRGKLKEGFYFEYSYACQHCGASYVVHNRMKKLVCDREGCGEVSDVTGREKTPPGHDD